MTILSISRSFPTKSWTNWKSATRKSARPARRGGLAKLREPGARRKLLQERTGKSREQKRPLPDDTFQRADAYCWRVAARYSMSANAASRTVLKADFSFVGGRSLFVLSAETTAFPLAGLNK